MLFASSWSNQHMKYRHLLGAVLLTLVAKTFVSFFFSDIIMKVVVSVLQSCKKSPEIVMSFSTNLSWLRAYSNYL